MIKHYKLNGRKVGKGLFFTLAFVALMPFAGFAQQPANDNCSGAVVLTVNSDLNCGVTSPGTLSGATASTGVPTSSCGTFDDDVWYSFVATASTHVINIAHVSGSYSDYIMQVIDGSAGCGNTTALLCSDPTSNVSISGLTPSTTYYLRIAGYNSSLQTSTFTVCVGTLPPSPANDDCSGAVALTVNSDLNCGSTSPGMLSGATASVGVPASNCGTFDDDVWYSFVATASTHIINIAHISGSYSDYIMQVINGSAGCGNTTALLCSDPTSNVTVSGLIPSTIYYLRVAGYNTAAEISSFSVCVGTVPPPPANDDCSGAIVLTVNSDLNCGATSSGTLASATASTGVPTSSCGTFDDDVWYSFVATASTHVIDITHVSGSYSDYIMQVIDGSSGCGNPTALLCSDPTTGVSISGLVPSTTYYVRIAGYNSSSQTSNFNVCIGTLPPPPANDDCSGAITLTVNPDLNCGVTTPGTLASATASTGAPSSSCGTFDDDVWYSFVATTTTQVINIIHVSGGYSDYILQVIDGSGGCGNTTALLCSDPTTNVVLHNLTPSTTYYLRIAGYNTAVEISNFEVCIGTLPPPPANDDCSGAIALTVNGDLNCGIRTAGTIFAATTSTNVPSSNCGNFDDDVWYSFIATASTQVIDIAHVSGSYSDYIMQVIDASGGCGNTTALVCSDPTANVVVTGLTASTTYYLRIAGYNSSLENSNFTVCVGTPPPSPVNDDCSNAVALTVNPNLNCGVTTPGTLAFATASTGAPSSSCGNFNDDVWYTFTATSTSHVINITHVSGSYSDYIMQVIDGSSGCGNTTALICSDPTTNISVTGLTPSTTYYLRIAGYDATSQTSTFTVCVGTLPAAPVNDDCSGAIALTVNPDLNCGTTTPGTLAGATASTNVPSSSCGTFDDDVWYSFVATASTHVIDIGHVSGSYSDYIMQVIDGSFGCGNTSATLCSDPTDDVIVSGLTPSNTYYLRIAGYDVTAQMSNFNVCVGTLPPAPVNDNCSGAVALTVNPDLNCGATSPGTLSGATPSTGVPSSNCGNFDDDVWYSFVATTSTHVINIAHVSGSYSDYIMQVINGSSGCGNTTSLLCSDPTSGISISGLIPATTYYLRIAGFNTSPQTSNFNVCVGTIPPVPANDDCSGAIGLTVNPDLNCGVTTPGTLASATASTGVPTSSCGTFDDDVWYSFIATASAHVINIAHVSGSYSDYIMQVIDGSGGCGNTTALLCSDPTSNVNVTGLVPSTTYYLRIAGYNTSAQISSFNVCIGTNPPPPANDDCSGTVGLTVNADLNCGVTSPGTLASATASTGVPSSSCGTFDDDVWYSFVATAPTHVIDIIHVSGGYSDYILQVIDGSAGCGNTTALRCSDPTTGVSVNGLVPSTTYYLRVAGYNSSAQTSYFNVCIGTLPPPPANDNCINAIDITNGVVVNGVVTGATQSQSACNSTAVANDVWYTFTTGSTTSVITDSVNTINTGMDAVVQVFSGSCGTLTPMIPTAGTSFNSSNGCTDGPIAGVEWSTYNVAANTTYYLRVYSYSSATGSFTVNVTGTTLVIKLDQITAINQGMANRVNWRTLSEVRTDRFDLERSTDGQTFQTIYMTSANGEPSRYTYIDQEAILGINFYRLKMFDASGRIEYSSTVSATVNGQPGFVVEAFPNPVLQDLSIRIRGVQVSNAIIQITDITGKVLKTIQMNNSLEHINMSGLVNGIYIITYADANHTQTLKVNKQ